MQLLVVSGEELAKFLEKKQLEQVRLNAIHDSVHDARRRLDETRAFRTAANNLYHEALTGLDVYSDEWDIAHAADARFEAIEQEFVVADRCYQAAVARFEWTILQAQRSGITL